MKYLTKKTSIIALLIFFSSSLIFSQSNKPYAKNISVQYFEKEKTLSINWENPASNNISKIYIFYDEKPITSKDQLSKDKILIILDKSKTSYSFKNEKMFTPYFAVIFQLQDYSFYDVLIPSENSTLYDPDLEVTFFESNNLPTDTNKNTTDKVAIQEGLEEGKIRNTPLPRINIEEKAFEGNFLQTKKVKVSSYIFPEEMVENPFGVSYEIYNILANYYVEENFTEAAKELNYLLQNKFDEKTTARLYFYLGECYFFTEEYKKAIECFFLSEKQYPEISKQWQQYALNNISF